MASINEINISNFVATGLTTAIPRYTFTLEIKWVEDDGTPRVHGPQTYTYPNDIATMPLAVRRRFAIDMINATARVAIGVAQWSEYE